MTTWPEARAAKAERQRREHRFYTPDKLAIPCRYCLLRVPIALANNGIFTHPACGPQAPGEELSR